MWLGKVEAPTPSLSIVSPCLQAHGASLSSAGWMQAPAPGWAGGGESHVGGDRETVIRHLSFGIGKQLCLAEIARK